MKSLRQEFADIMLEVGVADPDLVVMVGDISHGILQPFAKACPGRYFNVGICEPTIVNMAAGLAKVGLVPVVHTIAPFIIERAYEQIKLDFGYQQLPINLISVGGAFDYAQLGCSHHCYADISLMSHFKRATIVCPGSPVEFSVLFKDLYRNGGINYFRLPEHPHGVDLARSSIKPGIGLKLRDGKDLTLVCFGTQLRTAIGAADLLAHDGIESDVLYFPTLKPFDAGLVRASVSKTHRVTTMEEGSAHDGVFNLVLRATMGINDVEHLQIAIDDFIHSYGSYEDLCESIGLSPRGVATKVASRFAFAGVGR